MRREVEDASEIAIHCEAIRRICRRNKVDAEPALKSLEKTALGIACGVRIDGYWTVESRSLVESPTAEVT